MTDPLGGLSSEPQPPPAPRPEPAQRTFRPPPATSTMVVLLLMIAGFLAQGITAYPKPDWSTFADSEAMLRLGSLFAPAVAAGDWWRLGSYAFLHIGLVHLVMNASALWVLMRPAEGAFGSAAALGLFAASAIAGGVASTAASMAQGSLVQAAGASGGIFGLFGATGALWIRLRHRVPPEAVRAAARAFLVNLLLNAAIAAFAPVDNWAHAGGFVAGLLLGLLAPLPVFERQPHHTLAQAALLCAALALAAAEGAAVARAVHPAERTLEGPGVLAKLPWYAAPLQPGIAATPGGIGLRALIGHFDGPPGEPRGRTVILGDRAFRIWQATPDTEALRACREVTHVVSRDEEDLRALVCCQRSSCAGEPAEALARHIGASLRSTR